MSGAVLDRIGGQPRATQLLRASLASPVHAYLFVGPPGTGKREAAKAFAAGLMCDAGGCGECPSCLEVLAERHPDLAVIERRGASILVPQAQDVVRLAWRTPRVGKYQVLVLVDFHLVSSAAPVLLKTIEEPPDTTIIIVLAETIPRELVTIASRCVRVEFDPLGRADVVAALVREGVSSELADSVAEVAGGRLDRARLLARDEGFAERLALWRGVPSRLDGTGAMVVTLASELVAAAAQPVEVLKVRQNEEIAQLTELAEQAGERSMPGRQLVEDRHRREQRRARTDELRAGLTALSEVYRHRLDDPLPASSVSAVLRALDLLSEAAERLSRNANETLLLEWLLCRLDSPA